MYDFSFEITYDDGADEYMDAFIDHDSLRSEAIYSCLDPSELWALESVTGDASDLEALEAMLLDESFDRVIDQRAHVRLHPDDESPDERVQAADRVHARRRHRPLRGGTGHRREVRRRRNVVRANPDR